LLDCLGWGNLLDLQFEDVVRLDDEHHESLHYLRFRVVKEGELHQVLHHLVTIPRQFQQQLHYHEFVHDEGWLSLQYM
jgi:hypothetical protein